MGILKHPEFWALYIIYLFVVCPFAGPGFLLAALFPFIIIGVFHITVWICRVRGALIRFIHCHRRNPPKE